MPLYPAFLASLFRWTGPSVPAAQAAQAVLGSLTCVAIYLGGAAFLTAETALLAGWVSAVYFGLAYPCGRILSEVLFAFVLAFFFAAAFRWRGRPWMPALVAALGAALYLVRPEGALAPLALAALGPRSLPGWRLRHSAAVLAALLAAGGAWGLRNRAALGVFKLGTTGAGFSQWAALPRTMNEKLGSPLGARPVDFPTEELAKDAFFRRAALSAVRAAPKLLLLKAAAFNLVSEFYPFLPSYEFTYMLLVPLWLYALVFVRERRELLPAKVLVCVWPLVFIVWGGADSRFRQLYAPLLVWLACAGWDQLRARKGSPWLARVGAAWLTLNAVVFLFWPQLRMLTLNLKKVL